METRLEPTSYAKRNGQISLKGEGGSWFDFLGSSDVEGREGGKGKERKGKVGREGTKAKGGSWFDFLGCADVV